VPLKDRYTPKTYAEHLERRRRMVTENICAHHAELGIIRRDGAMRYLAASCNTVMWDGAEHGLVTYQDITERKAAEETRRDVEQKAQVASRLAAIGEMAAGMAHEINNPLTAVIGYSDLALEHQDLPEEVKEDVRLIADSGHRVADIVSRLLAFARQSKTVRVCSDLNELIDATLKMRHYALSTGGIEVERSLDPNLPQTVVDPLQLQQVFLNLIVNAEQAMKSAHGRGTLHISTSQLPGGIIRIVFTDDGPGIYRRTLKNYFIRFSPLNRSAKAPAWDCRCRTASSRSTAASFIARASWDRAPASSSNCRFRASHVRYFPPPWRLRLPATFMLEF
jgi:C4-dicarboxylate-specific signal transduction histidine kinase